MFKKLIPFILFLLLNLPALVFALTAQLPQTGQAKCYNVYGSEIPCADSEQDGQFKKGAAWPDPRFSNNGDQTVTDRLTGLIWTRDGNAPGPGACGPGTDKAWQDGLDYVKCLNANNYLEHSDWRLPNRKELFSLINYGQSNTAAWLNSTGFTNVKGSMYWTSSTFAGYPGQAWFINMWFGHIGSGGIKNQPYYVWPVRGVGGN